MQGVSLDIRNVTSDVSIQVVPSCPELYVKLHTCRVYMCTYVCMYTLVQLNPQMRTLLGPRKSVLIAGVK